MVHQKKAQLTFGFLVSCFALITFPQWFPYVSFFAMTPFLILAILSLSFVGALWAAFFSGLIYDIYAPGPLLGIPSLVFVLTVVLLYQYKKLFSQEKPHILALFAMLFSLVSTLLFFAFRGVFGFPIRIELLTILSDLLIMPFLDGLYAFCLIFAPLYLAEFFFTPSRRMAILKWMTRHILRNPLLSMGKQ